MTVCNCDDASCFAVDWARRGLHLPEATPPQDEDSSAALPRSVSITSIGYK